MLVTNARVGFGQDIAVELARLGARVAVQYAHSERDAAESSVKRRRLRGGGPAVVQAELRAVSECDRTVEEAAEALGGLDVLVNNPGAPRDLGFLATLLARFPSSLRPTLASPDRCSKRAGR